MFLGYVAISVLTGLLYRLLSPMVEIAKAPTLDFHQPNISPATKSVLTKLAGLFSLDAFGGGLLTDALLAYWFFRRFGVSEESLGVLFFVVRLLNAISHLGAAWLARRIGLLDGADIQRCGDRCPGTQFCQSFCKLHPGIDHIDRTVDMDL